MCLLAFFLFGYATKFKYTFTEEIHVFDYVAYFDDYQVVLLRTKTKLDEEGCTLYV